MRSFFLSIALVASQAAGILAQELECSVQIVSQQVSNVDKTVFEALQTSIFEFMNNRKWTSDVFSQDERIECSILINVTNAISMDEFQATIQVQSRRPVFSTSYNSTIINHQDNDFQFKYVPYMPLEFSEVTHMNNLTSVLGFYAYLVIGLDYETFSPEGGTKYLQKAAAIVNNAQGAKEQGWKAFEGTTNRYWMIENYLNSPQFKPLRDCMYKYHRLGFDKLSDNVEEGRTAITDAINELRKVHRNKPNSFNVKMFFNAKADEIVNLYSQATPQDKARIISVLNEIDPGNTSKYEDIRGRN